MKSIQDSRLRTIDIMDIVCLDDKCPCDDRNINGASNRVDGVHYTNDSTNIIIPKILEKVYKEIEKIRG